ncbi:hypothetical protein BOTBODRAFT_436914 [Botryobasidium botryosum FD-172 SS1]|uniref:Uncharacterized protein n=1 Tax=Botryobasidium botryosum (strain FD-172 SS1) TaxID=930990 RepID=A0A067MUF6_BOTB1|nr:hypothetical protein BOTBODRAFT_436914 [Botryobasidium botryosum FD-172 SS1]
MLSGNYSAHNYNDTFAVPSRSPEIQNTPSLPRPFSQKRRHDSGSTNNSNLFKRIKPGESAARPISVSSGSLSESLSLSPWSNGESSPASHTFVSPTSHRLLSSPSRVSISPELPAERDSALGVIQFAESPWVVATRLMGLPIPTMSLEPSTLPDPWDPPEGNFPTERAGADYRVGFDYDADCCVPPPALEEYDRGADDAEGDDGPMWSAAAAAEQDDNVEHDVFQHSGPEPDDGSGNPNPSSEESMRRWSAESAMSLSDLIDGIEDPHEEESPTASTSDASLAPEVVPMEEVDSVPLVDAPVRAFGPSSRVSKASSGSLHAGRRYMWTNLFDDDGSEEEE